MFLPIVLTDFEESYTIWHSEDVESSLWRKAMSDIDTKKVLAHLNKIGNTSKGCKFCGANDWAVIGKVFELREFRGGAVGSPVIPVIPVTCNQCGNLLLFNAIAAGLVK
jgi:hypothetical protein